MLQKVCKIFFKIYCFLTKITILFVAEIKKILLKLSKEHNCEIIGRWRKACVTHFYWSIISTSEHLGELKLAKFKSFLYHVINKHKHFPTKIFNKCHHGVITTHKLWMLKSMNNLILSQHDQCYLLSTTFSFFLGSEAYEKLCDALGKDNLCKAIKKVSSDNQTSCLEGYHSVVNQFAPKMYSYSYLGMYCR